MFLLNRKTSTDRSREKLIAKVSCSYNVLKYRTCCCHRLRCCCCFVNAGDQYAMFSDIHRFDGQLRIFLFQFIFILLAMLVS